VDLEGVSGEDDALGDDACGVWREGCAHGDQTRHYDSARKSRGS
jgi:hypothetical protein